MTARLRALFSTAAALALAGALAPAAHADVIMPVGPNDYFTATVNGGPTPTAAAEPVIRVVCPGPATPGQLGHPAAGQTVEANELFPPFSGTWQVGFTGSAAKEIDAIISWPGILPAGTTPVNPPVVISDFGLNYQIPTSFELPCSGSGVVSFVPIPTSSTARGVAVNVIFENIAV
ncbi:MAG TPA: hypothetical protein VGS97_05315 [Actinocrinis sp.]|uniref:hypothetical protein n=1 Tax=Actinocrinis sp. TaxID=1920516 RepID=UPI002DDCCBD9|nr:hypothetical protein [Actinocrinis sp.]HEV2343493.1 hypothetical protein [Actinocrinis sp.]